MDFIGNQVTQLHHVDGADHDLLIKHFAGAPINQSRLPVLRQLGFFEIAPDVFLFDAVENGRGKPQAEQLRGPAQVCLQHLADVHA